jgi:hypothetical protein
MLGETFDAIDLIRVMELYRRISDEEKCDHADSVQESLSEALWCGILEEEHSRTFDANHNHNPDSRNQPYEQDHQIYKFTHDVWRMNIMKLTLDDWKRDMHKLIAEALGLQQSGVV